MVIMFISGKGTVSMQINNRFQQEVKITLSLYVTVYRKTRHNAAPSNFFFLHLRSCRRPDIELSKFYRRSFSRSHYNRPNRSLP